MVQRCSISLPISELISSERRICSAIPKREKNSKGESSELNDQKKWRMRPGNAYASINEGLLLLGRWLPAVVILVKIWVNKW